MPIMLVALHVPTGHPQIGCRVGTSGGYGCGHCGKGGGAGTNSGPFGVR